jgi:protein-S-isoprenylcysteine O-methyltransferase Ste14
MWQQRPKEQAMPVTPPDRRIAETPNRIPWPPILFLAALGLAFAGTSFAPLPLARPAPVAWTGGLIALAALGLMVWSFLAFARARANIRPDRAASQLIDTGPFSLSRNPIYLSEALLLAGLGLWNGSLWYVVALTFFVPAVTYLAIRREEAHMEALFGQEWRAYAGRVRRWL